MKDRDIDPVEFDTVYPPEQRFSEWMAALESDFAQTKGIVIRAGRDQTHISETDCTYIQDAINS